MKTKRFRLLTVLLAAVMLVALSLNVMAAKSNAVTQDGLTAQLFTDKDSYKAGESVKASVQVDNHTGREVFIFTQINVPEGVKLASESAAFDTRLQDGESWTTPGGVLLSASSVTTAGNAAATGDSMQAGLWIILTVLAVCGIVALIVYGKNKKTWLSIMLCMAMVAGMAVTAVPAQAADMNGDIYLECTIQVDGKDETVATTVSYVIYDEAETTEAPAATVEPTAEPTTEPTAEPTTEPTEAPVQTEKPAVTKAPATETPATEAPATEAPATEAPATEAPATEAPATEAPATPRPTLAPTTTDWEDSELLLSDVEQQALDSLLSGVLTMHRGSLKAYNGEELTMPLAPVALDKEMYVPLVFTAETLGTTVSWDAGTATGTLNGVTLNNDNVVLVEGQPYMAPAKLAEILNTPYFVHYGLVVFGKDSTEFDAAHTKVQNEMIGMVRYDRPTGYEVYTDLVENPENQQHPRLYATADDFTRIKGLIETDPFVASCFAYLKKQANDMLNTEPASEPSEARNISEGRIETLAFVYQITGEEKYAERAYEEMQTIANYENWNPTHFLDVGHIMRGMARGFDWLYNWMNEEQRELIRDAIVTCGIEACQVFYAGRITPSQHPGNWWLDDVHNWNPAINGPALEAILAVYDEDFQNNEAEEIILPSLEMALRALEIHFNHWDPDGGWDEGPDYSAEVVKLDTYIIALLDKAVGEEYGFLDTSLLEEGAYFILYMHGPEGDFNYGDAWEKKTTDFMHEFYLAKRLQNKSLGYERKTTLEEGNSYNCSPLELVWYDPDWIGDSMGDMELDKYFRKSEVVAMRSGWSDDSIFAGFLSGDNTTSHSQLDTGTYVLDWAGTRWVTDLGADNLSYNLSVGNNKVYRQRAEGHNTLVIDSLRYTFGTDLGTSSSELKELDFNDATEGFVCGIGIEGAELVDSSNNQYRRDNYLGINVWETVGTGTVSIDKLDDENKAVKFSNSDDSITNPRKKRMQLTLESAANNKVDINFRIRVDSLRTKLTQIPEIEDSKETLVQLLHFTSSGVIRYWNGSKYADATTKYTLGKGDWYDISIRIDIANDTYDAYIGEVSIALGQPLPSNLEDIQYINFEQGDVGTFYLDDLSVSAPGETMVEMKGYDFDNATVELVCGIGSEATLQNMNNNQYRRDGYLEIDTVETCEAGTVSIVSVTGEDGIEQGKALEIKVPADSTGKGRIQFRATSYAYPEGRADVDYRIRIDEAFPNKCTTLPQIVDSNNMVVSLMAFTADNKIQCLNNDTYEDAGTYTVGEGTWYDISIKLDIENGTYDLYIDGNTVKTGMKLPEGYVDLKFVNFENNWVKGAFLLDDLSVKIPYEGDGMSMPEGLRGNDQKKESSCIIDRYESKDKGALAVTDMTAAYKEWAESVVRGVMLTDNRNAFIVRDEVKLDTTKVEQADLYWFAHTSLKNTITLSEDSKSAIMTDPNGNRMWVGIIGNSDQDLVFTVMDCTPMNGSPNPTGQENNSATFQKLTICKEAATDMKVTVAYIPLERTEGDTPASLERVKGLVADELSVWTIPDGDMPYVDSLTLGGEEIEGFSPTKNNYTITVRDDAVAANGDLPEIEATKGGEKLTVTRATVDSPVAYFEVDGTRFVVNFYVREVKRAMIQGYEITEDDITAASTGSAMQAGHGPANVLDGDYSSRCALHGFGSEIILDFGTLREFSKLDLAMYNSENRDYKFEILVSEDGFEYESVGSFIDKDVMGDTTVEGVKLTNGLQTYEFGKTYKARFIKISLNGCYKAGTTEHDSKWNNVAEIR